MDASLIRLMQLCSSALPIGGFTYSQGLEWAVECQWVNTEEDLRNWLADLIVTNLQFLEIPMLVRMSQACFDNDEEKLAEWSDILLAYRETAELRLEEKNRGRSLSSLLVDLDIEGAKKWKSTLSKTQTACFSFVSVRWGIPLEKAAQGFAWAWLENSVISGVKLIPLGQVSGQRILQDLAPVLVQSVEKSLILNDKEMGSSSPALAYVSARHETQYTRLFRS